MNRSLVICGPTATGKTKLGIRLAKHFAGEIISADSRQVYSGMDIGTGKGLPSGTKFHLSTRSNDYNIGYYSLDSIKIWGYDLVAPNQDFSVGQYQQLILPVIGQIITRRKLPIIVGGTGLYLKSLTQPIETATIPPDLKLRHRLDKLSVSELQTRLRQLDSYKLSSMNHSDLHNPRRLIRAIEIASSDSSIGQQALLPTNQLWIGLTAPIAVLKQPVYQNVLDRATPTFTQEIDALEAAGFDWHSSAATATGYKIWKQHLLGKLTRTQAINLWAAKEHQYQRRQLTWFKKQSQITWHDITDPDYYQSIERQVKAWYS